MIINDFFFSFFCLFQIDNKKNLNSKLPLWNSTPNLIIRSFESRRNVLAMNNEWTHYESRINHTLLQYSYRIQCNDNYYGNSCTIKCTPRNDLYGHYNCGSNGEKICHQGWTSEYCDKRKCIQYRAVFIWWMYLIYLEKWKQKISTTTTTTTCCWLRIVRIEKKMIIIYQTEQKQHNQPTNFSIYFCKYWSKDVLMNFVRSLCCSECSDIVFFCVCVDNK